MPVVGPKSALKLREYIQHPSPPMATVDWMEAQIGSLSYKPQRKATVRDMDMILKIYTAVMAEYSRVDLGYAIGRLLREKVFFPDISEIVELAEYARGQRIKKRTKAQMLLTKHEREWTPPIPDDELADVDEVSALVSELSIASRKDV